MDKDEERKHMVEQRGEKWVLVSGGGEVLGTHDTKEAAEAQERAIQAQKHMTLETLRLDKVFVFKEGRWNGDRYATSDLDSMVEAFHATKESLKPYLKFGHGDDTLPAIGWVENLYRVGQNLYADISGVPKKVYDLIVSGAYKRVSPEIFINLKLAGKKYAKALKAIGLLGGETPAVMDRENVINVEALYASQMPSYAGVSWASNVQFEFDHKGENSQENKMTDTDKDQEIGSLKTQVAELTKKLSESEAKVSKSDEALKSVSAQFDESKKGHEALKAKYVESEAQLAKECDARRTGEINSKLDKMVEDKKIVPAQREALFAILKGSDGVRKYTAGGKEYDSQEALVLAFIDGGAKVGLPTEGRSEVGESQAKDLNEKAKQYAAQNKVSFRDALIAVAPRGQ